MAVGGRGVLVGSLPVAVGGDGGRVFVARARAAVGTAAATVAVGTEESPAPRDPAALRPPPPQPLVMTRIRTTSEMYALLRIFVPSLLELGRSSQRILAASLFTRTAPYQEAVTVWIREPQGDGRPGKPWAIHGLKVLGDDVTFETSLPLSLR